MIFPTTHKQVRILILRASDVPTYVENGAADIGVAGKDVLMEHGAQNVYEPLDLKIAVCKLMTAGKVGMQRCHQIREFDPSILCQPWRAG